jgi:tungstate transport system substrate-binding protein
MVRAGMMVWWLAAAACLAGLPACRAETDRRCSCAGRTVRLATTTSVENTGLLAALIPPFEERTCVQMQVIAVGTGQALKLAENGDADVVLVHDPDAEAAFLAAGHGIHPIRVMHNDFVLVGPADDPARVREARTAADAFARMAAARVPFVSRGDKSGTHMKELRFWKAAGVRPDGTWYMEAGVGQMLALKMADEKGAYCLLDRGTYVAGRRQIKLALLFAGDPEMVNPYTVIPVNPAKHPDAAFLEAYTFAGWITSPAGQGIIRNHKVDGETLFVAELPEAE